MRHLAVILALLATAGCATAPPPQPPTITASLLSRSNINIVVSDTSTWTNLPGFQGVVSVRGTWDSANVTVQHSYDGGTTAVNSGIGSLVAATADVEESAWIPRAAYRILFNSGSGGSTSLRFTITPAGPTS